MWPALFWPSNHISVTLSKESWNTNSKEYIHPYVHSSVICNSQDQEAAQVPVSRWVDQKVVVYLHDEITHSCKKEGTLTHCDSMDGPEEYYVKWNKPVSERQIPYDLTYM